MMTVGLCQNFLLASGQGVPQRPIGGHAHLGVLSILAIVLGFAVTALGITGRFRTVVTASYVTGQWGLPLTPWLAGGAGLEFLHPTGLLWGTLLVVAMLVMTWQAAISSEVDVGGPGGIRLDSRRRLARGPPNRHSVAGHAGRSPGDRRTGRRPHPHGVGTGAPL